MCHTSSVWTVDAIHPFKKKRRKEKKPKVSSFLPSFLFSRAASTDRSRPPPPKILNSLLPTRPSKTSSSNAMDQLLLLLLSCHRMRILKLGGNFEGIKYLRSARCCLQCLDANSSSSSGPGYFLLVYLFLLRVSAAIAQCRLLHRLLIMEPGAHTSSLCPVYILPRFPFSLRRASFTQSPKRFDINSTRLGPMAKCCCGSLQNKKKATPVCCSCRRRRNVLTTT